ncbi:MAG: hypothetical protein KGJ13_05155 [Patescibacteria group bacterium]|nr:hypothetical protein [Patescibacteria group bacterium]
MPEEIQKSLRRVKIALWILAAVAVFLAIFLYVKTAPPPNGTYDALAKCIASTTAKFYGAFWCPHCADQKREFGDAAKYLPYVECSLPDASGETAMCKAIGIGHYPTWIFPNGSRVEGVIPPAELANKTGCLLQ